MEMVFNQESFLLVFLTKLENLLHNIEKNFVAEIIGIFQKEIRGKFLIFNLKVLMDFLDSRMFFTYKYNFY
jgi:hypothetical protein